jgi:hypothetical protein
VPQSPRAGADGALDIHIERLHYGKLAEGEERRIPSSEGYGVTRRSRGLDPAFDRAFLPPTLMSAPRFSQEMIDAARHPKGALLVRAAPQWPDDESPLVMLRARFRSESGEGREGRLYQQSAVWAADFDLWRRFPATFLALAQHGLEAEPDLVEESAAARFQSEPLRLRVKPYAGACASQENVGALLDVLAKGARTGEDCVVTFGEGCDFASEAAFLAGVGLALQQLPPNYPRWRDVSVLSGLRQILPGLCLRFLPGYAGETAERSAA